MKKIFSNDSNVANSVGTSGSTHVKASGNTEAVAYSNPAYEGEYPVIAYDNVDLENTKTGWTATDEEIRALLTTVKQCGFNVNLFHSGRSHEEPLLKRYFAIAESLGLRTVLSITGMIPAVWESDKNPGKKIYNPSPYSLKVNCLDLYQDFPNLWGYFLMDEPKPINWQMEANETPGDDEKYPLKTVNLTLGFKTYKQNNHGHAAFFILAVDVAEKWIGKPTQESDVTSVHSIYYDYLRRLTDKLHPAMLTVDYYPIFQKVKAGQTEFGQPSVYDLKENCYQYLEAIADFSRDYRIPVWMFMLCSEHTLYWLNETTMKSSLSGKYPYPTVEYLRFQAMTALAYGFQGIAFWTYALKTLIKNFDEAQTEISEQFFDAPYVDGHTTQIWNNCKTVISEIKQYGKPLLGAEFIGARHVYTDSQITDKPGGPYNGTTKFDRYFGCIADAKSINSRHGFVITHLKKGNENFMAIVNHDPFNSQRIKFAISSNIKWSELMLHETLPIPGPAVGNAAPDENDSNVISGDIPSIQYYERALNPGGMILISY